MIKKSADAASSKKVPRESDNPIVEEYKEDLLNKPGYGHQPSRIDEERLSRIEGLLGKIQERLADLEKRIKAMEER